jgi:hypothetical protein
MTDIEQQARFAAINRLWMHTVGVVNRIPTVAHTPLQENEETLRNPARVALSAGVQIFASSLPSMWPRHNNAAPALRD